MKNLMVRFSPQTLLVDEIDAARFVHQFAGDIVLGGADDDEGTKIGAFSAFTLDFEGAVTEGTDPIDVFDQSSDIFSYRELYTDELDFTSKVLRASKTDDYWQPNLLVIDRLTIDPAYRGHQHGLRALRWLVARLSIGCGMAACTAWPQQFERRPPVLKSREELVRDGLQDLRQDFALAVRTLKNHYARVGFRPIPGTNFMVMAPAPKAYSSDDRLG